MSALAVHEWGLSYDRACMPSHTCPIYVPHTWSHTSYRKKSSTQPDLIPLHTAF